MPNPVSPYGYHAKMTEDLLAYHARFFGTRITVVRFFSIYGPGLTKQLLWDAAAKLLPESREVAFWGTGEETRDWIHIDDATALMLAASQGTQPFDVVNGAGGERVTVARVLGMFRDALDSPAEIRFNGAGKPGDPRYYLANIERARALGWQPRMSLSEGLQTYVTWLREHGHAQPAAAARPTGPLATGSSQ